MTTSTPLQRRLSGYWKMEGGCALAFPVLALLIAPPRTGTEAGVLALALLACCGLLIVGALYWRAALLSTLRRPAPMRFILAAADRLQWPLLVLSGLSVASVLALLWWEGASASATASAIFALLSVLEYVNYFHVQLQNFDHPPDFRRLVKQRRLRPAHLAADLRDYRGLGHR